MVSINEREAGVSLIELMITIAILGILATVGISLTSVWSKQMELDKAAMSIKSAMSLARSTAMRNEFPKQTADIASKICFDKANHVLSVHKTTAADSASCLTPIVFKYVFSSTIEIKNTDATDFACFSFNHFGQITNDSGSCGLNLSLRLINGSIDETLNLS
ncbi:prepilin-type N-terminal cleavage/methylation domain-containing protein [Psychrobacter sp. B38]|uniref:pilus assembly FimT family protein n=1 Tax=Psychrobacter sp. B38 TaxID=3143538 RepID=UPI00320F7448